MIHNGLLENEIPRFHVTFPLPSNQSNVKGQSRIPWNQHIKLGQWEGNCRYILQTDTRTQSHNLALRKTQMTVSNPCAAAHIFI